VLEALGQSINLTPEQVGRSIRKSAWGSRPTMCYEAAAPVRKELGVRTIFISFGPLTNPAVQRIRSRCIHPDLVGIQAGAAASGSRQSWWCMD
jgi:anthranilate phosphoribosyltransferase